VAVRRLDTLGDARTAEHLFGAVWRTADGSPALGADLIRAVVGADGYAVGAFVGRTMVGACVGFWASPGARLLHSHITGVASEHRTRRVGYALKLDQRAYALERSADTITWTFDPLVLRNAHFNLRRLGARPVAYHVNYYGEMIDGVNGTDETDRFLVRWDLVGDTTRRACDLVASEPVMDEGAFHAIMGRVREAEAFDDARRLAVMADCADRLKADFSRRYIVEMGDAGG
jgi:predicted GNAT superfamily acetyltransferase